MSLDDNPYLIQAILTDAKGTNYTSSMIPSLSVDNVDDVGPRSTSRILSLSDAYNLLEAVDGVYVAGGLLAEGVESPVLSVRAEITADPVTFASVNLFVDGNLMVPLVPDE